MLHSISAVYEQLVHVLPTVEVTKLAASMLDALPKDLPAQIVQAKLVAVRNLVTSTLFHDDGNLVYYFYCFNDNKNCVLESRNILLANACKHLRSHLTRRDELKLCTEILGEILSFLYKQRQQCEEQGKMNNCIHHDVDTLCISTLDVLIQTILVIIDKDTKVIVRTEKSFFFLFL